ncbi:phosphatase PAP2 family protein [Pontibacter sp. 172403-2]|uniref:phosphatase PAP2 family protein n=1 Tax=Pontibacter rufus TaxID=2791028 RepID=UPI0018AFE654|nr:phosphatase PAP2 family protein [Pontibacter sp. 172403-2]MBF9253945.1 phosphatase PAP2 family protein [Pontibacter sp. 172403-2]
MIRSFYKKMAAEFTLFTVELLFVLGVSLACVVGFLYIGAEILQGDQLGIDKKAFAFAHRIVSPAMNAFIESVTFFASQQFITPAALLLIAYFLFIRKHRWHSIRVPVVALGSISLNLVLKHLFDRPRPLMPLVHASGLSFPSGHSMIAASFYGLIIYLVWKNVKRPALRNMLVLLLALFILLIGFSRIYLRVHYATDVLAGFSAGFLWVIISLKLLRSLEKFSKKEITPVLMEEEDKKT